MSIYTTFSGQSLSAKTQNNENDAYAIVQEYYRLSKLAHPSNKELNQIGVILELAQYDPVLSNLINGADHLIAYELGLSPDLPMIGRKEKYSDKEKTHCASGG